MLLVLSSFTGRLRAARIAALTLALVAPLGAQAAQTVDQQNLSGGAGIGPTRTQSYQQALTAGATGLLTQVDLHVLYLACCTQPAGFAATNTFQLDIWDAAPWNGAPVNSLSPLASFPLTVTQIGWLSVDVSSAGLVLAPGQAFGIGVRSDVYWDLGLDSSPFNPYGGGSLWGNGGVINSNPQGVGAWDLVFRTYVDPLAAVPEPASAALMGLGLAAVATRAGRRRASAG